MLRRIHSKAKIRKSTDTQKPQDDSEVFCVEDHCRFCKGRLYRGKSSSKISYYVPGETEIDEKEVELSPRAQLSADRQARINLVSSIVGALGDRGLSILRDRFEESRQSGGLLLDEFIQLLLSQLPSIEELQKEVCDGCHPKDRDEVIVTLTDLFADIKGLENRLSWSEFTAYITDHIIAPETSTINLSEADLIPPYRKSLYSQAQRHLHQVQQIKYCANIDSVAVLEKGVKYIKLYNTNTSQQTAILQGNRGIPMSVDYINSKYYLVTACANNTIAIWDCNAGITQYQIAEKPAGTPLRWLTDDVQMSLHYSEKVQKLYSGSTEGKLYIWDINDREEIGQLKHHNKSAHQDMVMDIKFIDSLDNILTCSMDKTIGLWDVYTGHRRQLYSGHTKGVLSVDYMDTLQIVVSAGFDHDIYLWGPFTGQLVKRLSGHMFPLTGVYSVPNTYELISVDCNGTYKIWDVRTFECVQSFYDEAGSSLNGQLTAFCYDQKHHRIFGSCRRMQIYEQKPQDRTKFTHLSSIASALYEPVSLTFVTSASKTIKIWDALTGKIRYMYQDIVSSDISYMCLHPSGKRIYIGCNNGSIKVYDYPVLNYIKDMAPHKGEVTAIHYIEKDNAILTTSWDRFITVQDDSTNDRGVVTRVFTLDLGHIDDITHCIFDYKKDLVVTGSPDCSVRFWIYSTGKPEGNIQLRYQITALCLLSPYPVVAIGDSSGHISFWGTNDCIYTYQELLESPHYRNGFNISRETETAIVSAICYDKKRNYLITGDVYGYLHAWNINQAIKFWSITGKTSKAQKVSVTLDRLKELMPANCFWLEWRCQSHTDLISSIQLIEKPRSLLITSDDGRVSICNENGTRLGVLLTEHDPEAKWSFNIDVDEIYHTEEDRLEHVKSDLTRLPRLVQKVPEVDNSIESLGDDETIARRYTMSELREQIMNEIPRLKEKSVREYSKFDLTD